MLRVNAIKRIDAQRRARDEDARILRDLVNKAGPGVVIQELAIILTSWGQQRPRWEPLAKGMRGLRLQYERMKRSPNP